MQKRLYYKRAVTDGYSNSSRRNQTNITCHITLHYTVVKVWPRTLRNPLSLFSLFLLILFLFRFPSIFIFWAKRVMETNGVVSSEEVHVLAVDDSLVDRKVIERLLKISACKVTAVDSGIRALQFLGLDEQRKASESDGFVPSLKVDLVITDYCMPGMTGYELLKKIKESSTFREIPVVIMSSENILPRIDRCLEEGAEDFIVKPVKLSDVKRLKGYMTTKEVRAGSQDREVNGNGDGGGGGCVGINNKRKHQEASDLSSSPSPSPPSISSSTTLSSSPSSSPLSSPSSSPSVLDSPIRRLKMTGTD